MSNPRHDGRGNQREREGRAMRTVYSRIRIVSATIGLAVSFGQSVYAADVTVITPSLLPPRDGYLQCDVNATSPTPIGIVAVIKTRSGADVTDFSNGFRASPAATGGSYYAEQSAGSISNKARYCEVTVTGAQSDEVHVTFKACKTAADGSSKCTNPIQVQ